MYKRQLTVLKFNVLSNVETGVENTVNACTRYDSYKRLLFHRKVYQMFIKNMSQIDVKLGIQLILGRINEAYASRSPVRIIDKHVFLIDRN